MKRRPWLPEVRWFRVVGLGVFVVKGAWGLSIGPLSLAWER